MTTRTDHDPDLDTDPNTGQHTGQDTGQDAERSELIALPRGTAAVYCARCPFRETPNEDGAVVIRVDDSRSILAVADGMGGEPGGAQASDVALEAIVASVETRPAGAGADGGEIGLRPIILNGFEAANRRVRESGSGGGSTLAVVEIDGVTMRPYHVGDSEILVIGQRGKIKLQTVAHSPVGYAVEAGLLDASDALHHEDRHLVSNFIGAADMRIDVGPTLALRPRDTVVIGSDGLFDNLHVEEVVEIARKGALDAAAGRLAAAARDRMLDPKPGSPSKADDLTFILYRPLPPRR